MPLGIFPGFLAGAGQGLAEQQKLQQQQQEAAIRTLLLQRSLRQDAEKQRADEVLLGAPPLVLPPAPVGTPPGDGSGSSMPPSMSLFGGGRGFGGGDQGSAARAVDRGFPFPTQAGAPQLPPNTTGFGQDATSGPGYPTTPSGPKEWQNIPDKPMPAHVKAYFGGGSDGGQGPSQDFGGGNGDGSGGGQGPAQDFGAGGDSASAVTSLFRPPTAVDPALPTRDPAVAARTLPVSQASMQTGGGPGAAPAAGYRPPGPFGAMAPSAMGGAPGTTPGATPAAFTPGGAGGQPSLTDLSSLATPEVNKEVQETYPKLAQADNRQAYAQTVFSAITKYVEDNCRGCDAKSKAILRDRLIKERGDPAIKQYNETYKEQVLERFRIEQQQRSFEQQEKMKRESERIAAERAEKAAETQGQILFRGPDGKLIWVKKGGKIPEGAVPESEAGRGVTAGAGREKDIEARIQQLDARFKRDNPKATEDEIADAHFKHRQDAEHGLATAKAAPARNLPMAIAQKYMETHPDASHEDLIRLGGAVRREQSIQTAFAGGEAGRQLRSLNTLVDHISLSREYADAIQNGDIPRANALINRWAIETGHPEVNDFNAARTIMADEVVRLLTNTGGTETDRKDMQAIFDPNAAPEQLAGAMNVAQRFVTGRLTALEQQYARNDPARQKEFREQMLTPEAARFFGTPVPTARERQGPLMPQGGPQAAPPSGGSVSIPAEAIEALRAGDTPERRTQFDQVFGEGAAARVLGQ